MTRGVLLLLLILLVAAAPAAAQLRGTTAVGIGVGTIRPAAPELTTRVRVRPLIRRVPSRGLGMAMALNWFEADVSGEIAGVNGRLGSVAIRPLMFGIGYTFVRGRIGITPSVVAGPALNTLDIDDEQEQVALGGGGFEERAGTISVASRLGASVTLAIAPRLGLTGFGGYFFNRPTFTLQTPSGERTSTWNTGGVLLSAGAVISF